MRLHLPLARWVGVWVLALTLTGHVAAQGRAGTAIFVTGPVNVQRAQLAPLSKGDAVLVGDIVVTGPAGRAQLQMSDGAKVAIRPDSRLQIDAFTLTAPVLQPASVVAPASTDRSAMTLLKGGFRTITGLIGTADEEAYEVRTPVGTLGIRGTEYAALYCAADCLWAPGGAAGQPPADGLYVMATLGTVTFRNELADVEIEAGQFLFVPLIDRLPQLMDAPPPVVLDQFDVVRGAVAAASPDPRVQGFGAASLAARRVPSVAAASQSTAQGNAVPAQSVVAVDLDGAAANLTTGAAPPAGNRTLSYVTGPLGQPPVAPFGGTRDNTPAEYRLDANNNASGFAGPYPRAAGSGTAAFAQGSAANVNVGFDSVTMLRWGRWSQGTVTITLAGNVNASQDMTGQSLHWVGGPQNGVPAMPVTGSASYRLVGGTSPTDNLGNVGALGSATFAADFTNQTVASALSLTVGGSPWTAAGNGLIGPRLNPAGPVHVFGGAYTTVTAGGTVGAGFFNGFFSAPGARNPSLPGGAGLTYALQDGNGATQVSGAAIFGDPN